MADAPLMAGKSVLVTGGTGGIGKATATGHDRLGRPRCRRSPTTSPVAGCTACGGFHYAAVALVRARLGLAEAGHAESDPDADQHVIVALQCALYGERGTVTPVPGTRLASIWLSRQLLTGGGR
jgi:CTP synthase (UTP-ammonia lyase)